MEHILPLRCQLARILPAFLAAAFPGAAAGPANNRMPLFFVPDPAHSGYSLHWGGLTAHFARQQVIYELGGERLSLHFAGARTEPALEARERQPGIVNYLIGMRPDAWKRDVPTYGAIVYRELYAGIDLIYDLTGGEIKSEFRVAAGADAGMIRWRYQGADSLKLDPDGSLRVTAKGAELRERKPVLYQPGDNGRAPVQGGFRLFRGGSVGFQVGAYDRGRALVIDPILSYSTYLGGSGMDSIRAMAVDSSGNAYVAGYTTSLDLPVAGAVQAANRGGVDAFVAKLNAAGTALVYCTYLGGSYDDRAFGIAVDSSGSAYVTGWTYSSNFPTTNGARQRALFGGRDAFVAKLNAAGNALLYSTFLGGSSHDSGNAIAVDGAGNAYVAGDTYSTNFPVLNGYRSTNAGRQDAFISKLNPAGSSLIWSTYLGGSGDESGAAVAVDAAGKVYLAGGTTSTNFPTYQATQSVSGGNQDAFVAMLYADGRSLGFSTYLGGSKGTVGAGEAATAIGVDAAGSIYVTGYTSSTNFPTANAYRSVHLGGILDCFVAKLDPGGSGFVYSTYFGGAGVDYCYAVSVDSSGAADIAGYTSSSNLPLAAPLQAAKAGGYDAFVAKFSPAGDRLEFATYLGGSQSETANALAADAGGNLWIAGQTLSTNFPLKHPIQSSLAGGYSAFVTRLGQSAPTAVFRSSPYGNTIMTTYGSTSLSNGLGTIASAPAISQNSVGDTFVAGRTAAGCVYLNHFSLENQAWDGSWALAGCGFAGDPAVAAEPSGGAYVVARDASFHYWINHYVPGAGFGGWIALGGDFAVDPTVAHGTDGAIYVLGRNSAGVVAGGRYVPGSGFRGWFSGPTTPLATGKPGLTIGSDGAAYVAIRSLDGNNIWMARLQGDVWGTWMYGGGTAKTDPELAATGGMIYTAVTDIWNAVYLQAFREGAGNGWQGWQFTNGTLTKASIAATGGRYFIVGKVSSAGPIYWYESGVGWTYLGYPGLAASDLSAAPR